MSPRINEYERERLFYQYTRKFALLHALGLLLVAVGVTLLVFQNNVEGQVAAEFPVVNVLTCQYTGGYALGATGLEERKDCERTTDAIGPAYWRVPYMLLEAIGVIAMMGGFLVIGRAWIWNAGDAHE